MLFARSLAVALEDYEEIGRLYAAQDLQSIGEILDSGEIDIVLMDINLGKLSRENGLDAAAGLLEKYPGLKIIMLTGYDLPVYRHEARKYGVSGFLNKNISPDDLAAVLRSVFSGQTCFPCGREEWVAEELTETEKKILKLVGSGKKRKQIADELYISERTLSNHLQHIFEKLDVSSTVEAVAKALQMGYLCYEQ